MSARLICGYYRRSMRSCLSLPACGRLDHVCSHTHDQSGLDHKSDFNEEFHFPTEMHPSYTLSEPEFGLDYCEIIKVSKSFQGQTA